MNWIKDFDLFLFDFDGLLVNTEHLHFQAYRNMCEQRGFILDWTFPEYCAIAHVDSKGFPDALYASVPGLRDQEPLWSVLYREKSEAYKALLGSGKVELMPGAAPLLEELQRRQIERCVVTHSRRELVELIRGQYKVLQTIPHWITREDYAEPKPNPESYLRAIALHGKGKRRIIGFEDSLRGLKALMQTPALPVLIAERSIPDVLWFPSLDKIDIIP